MIYIRTERFKKGARKLPIDVQEKVKKAFELFKSNPQHSSLGIKKIKGHIDIWEGRIDDFYRFTFEYGQDEAIGERVCYFRNIGRHEIIDHNP